MICCAPGTGWVQQSGTLTGHKYIFYHLNTVNSPTLLTNRYTGKQSQKRMILIQHMQPTWTKKIYYNIQKCVDKQKLKSFKWDGSLKSQTYKPKLQSDSEVLWSLLEMYYHFSNHSFSLAVLVTGLDQEQEEQELDVVSSTGVTLQCRFNPSLSQKTSTLYWIRCTPSSLSPL